MHICLAMLTAILVCSGSLRAQTRSVGTSWSFSGIGVTYEHTTSESSFVEINARTDLSKVFIGKTAKPGASASFTWNMIFAQTESRNGFRITCYSGPGATLGWSEDLKTGHGLVFGIKGRVGVCCLFDRNIMISAGIAPELGIHASGKAGAITMNLYRSGITFGLLPEIGIKYAF